MKKIFVIFLLICIMAFSFAIPVMASDAVAKPPISAIVEQVEISPFTEFTQIFWRNHQGQLQMRVWSLTYGRWLTDWIVVIP